MSDPVTGEEFSRWMNEQANFRSRLEQRLEAHHTLIRTELTEIKQMVRETNGKTQKHGEDIKVIQRELEAIKDEDAVIEQIVGSIKDNGCSQYATHVEILKENAASQIESWSKRKKAAVVGTLVGTGALLVPLLNELVRLFDAVMHLSGK